MIRTIRDHTLLVLVTWLLCGVFVLGLAPSAGADSIYTYTGNLFFPSSNFVGNYACPPECRVTGSFTVPQPLPVNVPVPTIFPITSFSFTDGNTIWTNSNASGVLAFGTDSTGAISEWAINLSFGPVNNPQFFLATDNFQTQRDQTFLQCNSFPGCVDSEAFNESTPGTWSLSSTVVPEPSTVLLVGTALLGIAGAALRKGLA